MPRPSILHKTEAAFVAALQARFTVGVLAPCHIYAGQSVIIGTTVETPALTVTASQPVELAFDTGMFDLRLVVRVETQIYQEPTTPADDVHHDRVQAVRDFLEDFSAMSSALAATSPALAVSSLKLEAPGEEQSQEDNVQVTEIFYSAEVS